MRRLKARIRNGELLLQEKLPPINDDSPFLLWVEPEDLAGTAGAYQKMRLGRLLAHAKANEDLWNALEEGHRQVETGQCITWEEMKEKMGWSNRPPTKIELTELDQWVLAKQPDQKLAYVAQVWDHIEWIRRLMHKFHFDEARMLGEYVIHTPPPCEELQMPLVELARPGLSLMLKYDFSWRCYPYEWLVTVRTRRAVDGVPAGLFKQEAPVDSQAAEGVPPEHIRGPYSNDPRAFSCQLEDELDLGTLLRLATAAAGSTG